MNKCHLQVTSFLIIRSASSWFSNVMNPYLNASEIIIFLNWTQKITQSKAGLAQNTEYLLCSVPINIITQDYCEIFHLVVIYRFSIFNLPFWNTSPICDNLGVFYCSMICKKLFKLLFRSLESENVENARVIFFSRKIYSPWSK